MNQSPYNVEWNYIVFPTGRDYVQLSRCPLLTKNYAVYNSINNVHWHRFSIKYFVPPDKSHVCVWDTFCVKCTVWINVQSLVFEIKTRYVQNSQNPVELNGLQPFFKTHSILHIATFDENAVKALLILLVAVVWSNNSLHDPLGILVSG